ncbi:hypothetical protein DPMN_124646 [Dreissena polymorpha]|uniref:Uncharacterized protein n=1 Tax=Dreissena polymorpha TaxID=45954 RepID=A0A9D4GWR9_DREPO|nr:hypothetical protein DPMN_124646 [Dreissena polymorpha]
MSAGGVTVYQGSAGMLPGCCRDAAGFHRGSPGHYRRQPGLLLGFTGINRSQFGVDRDSAGLLTGFNRGGTGKKCDRVKTFLRIIPVLTGRPA